MERSEIARQVREKTFLSGDFTLRSGARSDTYFDKYRFESDPMLLRAICEALAELLPADTDMLLGMELGGVPVATVLSQVTGLPAAFVRKARKTHGTCKFAEGPELQGLRCVVVEDVVSSGGAILDSLRMLREEQVDPALAVCVIDRETGGLEALRAEGMELRAAFRMSEVLGAA